MTDINQIRAMFASRLAPDEEDRGRQVASHTEVREAFTDLAMVLADILPEGHHKSLVMTKLEEAAMWANKAVASPYPIVPAHKEGRQSLEAERLRESSIGEERVVHHEPRPGETYGQFLDRRRAEMAAEAEGLSEWGRTAE